MRNSMTVCILFLKPLATQVQHYVYLYPNHTHSIKAQTRKCEQLQGKLAVSHCHSQTGLFPASLWHCVRYDHTQLHGHTSPLSHRQRIGAAPLATCILHRSCYKQSRVNSVVICNSYLLSCPTER